MKCQQIGALLCHAESTTETIITFPKMEKDKGPVLQTASSLLCREGPKKVSDGHVHTAGSGEARLTSCSV